MDSIGFNTKWNTRKLRGLSIQQRLPLLISILLLTIMISFSLVSYFGIRKSTLNIGKERLSALTNQLSDMLGQSAQAMIAKTTRAAMAPAIIESAGSRGFRFSDDAMESLQRLQSDTTTMLVEIRDTARKSLMQWGKDSIQYRVDFGSLLTAWPGSNNDTAWVGRIYQIRDSLYFPVIVSIRDNKVPVGYFVHWHLLKSSPEAIHQLSQLIGAKSNLYIGNQDHTLWTDMRDPVVAPLIDTAEVGKILTYRNAKNTAVLGMTSPIPRTSWLVLIEFSRDAVLEAANRFMSQLILVGGIILVIGIFFAWHMSRNITRPLNRLTRAAPGIAAGDYSTPIEVNRKDEVGKLARSLNALAIQVEKAQKELEQKIHETEEINHQLRGLSAHLQNVREEERIHIAREMHDELGQLLTGFKMDTVWLDKKIDNNVENGPLKEKLQSMMSGVDEAVKFVRKLAAELRPSLLDDLGLVAALEWYSQEFQKRYSISVDFKSTVEELDLTSEQATGIFRMYQESLTNVARHAKATAVIATFAVRDQRLSLSIVDNGKGFEINKNKTKTLGLLGMKERALMIGGHLEISSSPGKGTRVYITLPLEEWETQS